MISTNFGLYGLLQILHQNQPTIQQMLLALSQGEDLYRRRMYGLCKIQQNSCIAAHQTYNKKYQKLLLNKYFKQQS